MPLECRYCGVVVPRRKLDGCSWRSTPKSLILYIKMNNDSIAKTEIRNEEGTVCPLEYFCEICFHYPLTPVHGHFECAGCGAKTKCCEGA